MKTVSIISSFIACMFLLVTVIFVLIKDWRSQINRYYSFFALSGLGILLMMFFQYAFPESPYLTELNRISQFCTTLCFAALFVLSFVFPRGEKKFPFSYGFLMLLPAITVSCIAVFTDWTITRAYFEGDSLMRDFRFFYTIYALIAFSYLILAIVSFVRKYLITKIDIFRKQMRFVFLGTSIAVFFAAIFSIALPRFFNYTEMYVLGASIAAFLAIFSLYYSIISYQMMDITTAIHKTVMYAIISMAIFLPIYLIVQMHDSTVWITGELPPIILTGSIVFVFLLFSNYIQPVIDKAFKRRQYEFENILDTFIREVEERRDFRKLVEQSVNVLFDALFLRNAFFVSFDGGTKRYEQLYGRGEEIEFTPLDRNATVIRWFVRDREMVHIDWVYTDDKTFGDVRDDFIEFYSRYRLKLILPMYHGQRLLGILCLGEKDSLAAYKPDELDNLRQFQRESNTLISNALSYEEARKEQMIARTMELSSDIMSQSVPAALPNVMGIKFGALLIPKYGEGVDYFDFLRPGNEGIGTIVTDVSGSGVNSALYSVVLRSAFQSCIADAPTSYAIMQRLNRVLFEYNEGKGQLVTAYYFYYDIKSMRLIYTNGGFPALNLYRIEKNDFDVLDTEGIPLGHDPRSEYGMGRTNLLRGDIGVLFSKALIGTANQRGEYFEVSQLRTIVKESRGRAPQEIVQSIRDGFESFLGISLPESDIIVIVFKIV